MLCSVCKKNMAVVFINSLDKEGKSTGKVKGLCLECAKKQGIDPLSNIVKEISNMSEEEMEEMSNQFSDMFNNMGGMDGLPIDEALNDQSEDDDGDNEKKGNFFNLSNMFNISPFSNKKEDNSNNLNSEKNNNKEKEKRKKKNKKTKYLDTFGENLTEKARNGKLDKVIGREKELQRMIQILNRRSKNNPALIGEPGVGKTAIVNALAIAIAKGEVPGKLINKEVYLVDMTSLVAGTQFRGQFESRIKGMIDECKSLGNIILAIDEVHNIVGGLEHDNSMNAANMLKPALANGTVQLIGATTLKEYRQYIEKDSALERRFQPILVDEPTPEECFNILKGTKEYYESFHKVVIPDDVLKSVVELSDKYIHDRFLPDKAIDLLDEACARVNLDDITLAKIEKIENEISNIEEEEQELEDILDSTKENDKNEESDMSSFEKAATLKANKCKLQSELEKLQKKLKPRIVSFDNLADVIELWTKIPVSRIKTAETEKLLNLKSNLSKKIIGQDAAIEALSNAILRKRANIRTTERPPSFIFVGPTGVGKTALVKALAYELFDNEEAVIKLDMSEYMEEHSVSKLIGSPPGYVGYDEAGRLTEKVRRNPYSIVLFDEVEKAHHSVYNLLLQILDDGKLTDSQGRSVSFKHTIIILTSNLGTNFKNEGFGFANLNIADDMLKNNANSALKEFFSPEFLNRIDDTIVFNKLSFDNILVISDILLKELQEETKKRKILFDYTENVTKFIAKQGYNDKFGARPLKRAIQKYIEDEIAIKLIKGEIKENKKYTIDIKDNKVVIS